MSGERTQSEATILSAVPMLGGGSALVAASNIFDGTLPIIMLVAGAILILCGAAMLGKGMQQKKSEDA